MWVDFPAANVAIWLFEASSARKTGVLGYCYANTELGRPVNDNTKTERFVPNYLQAEVWPSLTVVLVC